MKELLLTILLVVFAVSPCFAQLLPSEYDSIIISFEFDIPCYCADIGLFSTRQVYLAIVNPTRAVTSFECELRVESEALFFGNWGPAQGWTMGVFEPPMAFMPIDGPATGVFLIPATFDLTVADVSAEIRFYIDPPGGQDIVTYRDPDGEPVPLARFSAGQDQPDAVCNSPDPCYCMWDSVETMTWSNVKALYR